MAQAVPEEHERPDLAIWWADVRPVDGPGSAIHDGDVALLSVATSTFYDDDQIAFDVRVDLDGQTLGTVRLPNTAGPYEGGFELEWNATAGDHVLTMTVDPDDAIAEEDEGNNVHTLDVYVFAEGEEPADLAVELLGGAAYGVVPGQTVWVDARVHNLGGTATGRFHAFVSLQAAGDAFVEIPDLEPGDAFVFGMSVHVPVATRHYDELRMTVGVGSGGPDVPQDDLMNDFVTAMVPVLKPDLRIIDVEIPEGGFPGEVQDLRVTVANDGDASWHDTGVWFDLEVTRTLNGTTESVDSAHFDMPYMPWIHDTVTYRIPWTVVGGNLSFDLSVGLEGGVGDADPSNDATRVNQTLAADLAVVDIRGGGHVALTGDRYYEVVVVNQGNLGINEGFLYVTVDGSELHASELFNLGAGSEERHSVYWRPIDTLSLPGQSTILAQADNWDGFDDVGNNAMEKRVRVTATPLGV